jgi:hypothetical protein
MELQWINISTRPVTCQMCLLVASVLLLVLCLLLYAFSFGFANGYTLFHSLFHLVDNNIVHCTMDSAHRICFCATVQYFPEKAFSKLEVYLCTVHTACHKALL